MQGGRATSTSNPDAIVGAPGGPRLRIVVFAKRPKLGEVKTRLAADIGPDAALSAYVELLDGVLRRLRAGSAWRVEVAVTPDDAVADEIWPVGVRRGGQGPGDLGQRMARVLADARPETPVIIVGSDIPGLGVAQAEAAFSALDRADLMLGPSPDGGYWVIGASRPPPAGLFQGVRWSSEHARADTLNNAVGLRVEVLDLWLEDVDDLAGYRRWRAGG